MRTLICPKCSGANLPLGDTLRGVRLVRCKHCSWLYGYSHHEWQDGRGVRHASSCSCQQCLYNYPQHTNTVVGNHEEVQFPRASWFSTAGSGGVTDRWHEVGKPRSK